jgi:transcriptional regulator with XRE-family HTH domain
VYAVAFLKNTAESQGFSQTHLEQLSHVGQSQISKIWSGSVQPTYEVLSKLAQGLGLTLRSILSDSDGFVRSLMGYLATPLTGLAKRPSEEAELERVVGEIKRAATGFSNPAFELYWPGDHTHPVKHPNFKAQQVYLTDRSRASTHDFIVLFCPAPSFGVGQENEIATQAGLPAIRIMPHGISRMMSGSFISAVDIYYSGDLENGIEFDSNELHAAFETIRKLHFRHRPLYKNVDGNDFGPRLRTLVDQRSGGYQQFSDELGINLTYLQVLMDAPFTISNPSAQLLKRMSIVLSTSVGFLLGESEESDPIWINSMISWRQWADSSPVILKLALELKDDWREEYRIRRAEQSTASFRKSNEALSVADWDARYLKRKKKAVSNGSGKLFK